MFTTRVESSAENIYEKKFSQYAQLSLLHLFSLIFSVQQNILQISRPFLLPHEAILYDDYENV